MSQPIILHSLLLHGCFLLLHGCVLCSILFSILLLLALISSPHKQYQAFWVALPSSGGDLNGEVGWREEREDLGGDVVAAVVHALAE